MTGNRWRTLFRYEMKTMRWFLLVGFVCALVMGMVFLMLWQSELSEDVVYTREIDKYMNFIFWQSEGVQGSIFSVALLVALRYATIAAVIVLAFMSAFQFRDSKTRKSGEFLASLPFTRSEQMAVKMVTGYGTIFFVWLAVAGQMIGIRSFLIEEILKRNAHVVSYQVVLGNETLRHTLTTMVFFLFVLLALYSVFILIHTLVEQGPAASLMGIGIVCSLYEIVTVADYFLYSRWELLHVDSAEEVSGSIIERLAEVLGSIIGRGYGNSYYPSLGMDDGVVYAVYEDMGWKYGYILLIFAGCGLLAWQIWKRRDLAHCSALIPSFAARTVISLGVSVCFSLGVVAYLFWLTKFESEIWLDIVLLVVVAVVVFVICQKLFRRVVR